MYNNPFVLSSAGSYYYWQLTHAGVSSGSIFLTDLCKDNDIGLTKPLHELIANNGVR